jgi:hypothetical protein
MYTYKDFHTAFAKVHSVLLGHNRFATKGSINSENAHPFLHSRKDAEGKYLSSILGVHNGTLSNQHDLKDNKKFDVDSDNLYYDMTANGVKETVGKIRGAFALAWYDSANRTINFCRNDERPLFYTMSTDNKTIFWASESWMLSVALNRHSIKYNEIKSVEVEKHYSMVIPKDVFKEDLEMTIEDVAFFRFPEASKSHWSHWYNKDSSHKKTYGTVTPITKATRKCVANLSKRYMNKEVVFSVIGLKTINKAKFIEADIEMDPNEDRPSLRLYTQEDPVLHKKLLNSVQYFKAKIKSISTYGDEAYCTVDHRTIVDYQLPLLDAPEDQIADAIDDGDGEEVYGFKGYHGRSLTFHQWHDITKKGCALCCNSPAPHEADKIVWIDSSEFFCESCSSSEFAVSYLYSGHNG